MLPLFRSNSFIFPSFLCSCSVVFSSKGSPAYVIIIAGHGTICGELTTTRCGACEGAGIDIFFCSKEHQKLVWPVHKLVCGPGKANPFLWPSLTDEEAADMAVHLDDQFCVTTREGDKVITSRSHPKLLQIPMFKA
ncbi:hypothetical protein JCM6882_009313 [Rhodosporidiobolus microsporus]